MKWRDQEKWCGYLGSVWYLFSVDFFKLISKKVYQNWLFNIFLAKVNPEKQKSQKILTFW